MSIYGPNSSAEEREKILATPNDGTKKENVDSSSLRVLRELILNHGETIRQSCVVRDGSHAMTGDLDMGNRRVQNLGDPDGPTDAVTKQYVDSWLRDTSENLDIGGKRIGNVGIPVDDSDVATKRYVDRLKPIITVWAEESTGLNKGQHEWSFGNGAEGRDHSRSGYTMLAPGRITRMGLCSGTTTDDIEVKVTVNGEDTTYGVTRMRGARSGYNIFPTPLELRAGSVVNFVSRVTARLASSSIVTLLIELDI